MPLFEYICRECQHAFETLVTGTRQPVCPVCDGRDLDKQFSTFAVSARRPAAGVTQAAAAAAAAIPAGRVPAA